MNRDVCVIGFLGINLDSGFGPERWTQWRPTISVCQQDDLIVHRLELIHREIEMDLALRVAEDIAITSPETKVTLHQMDLVNPWDFAEVYGRLFDWTLGFTFSPDRTDYLIHITTGTHVAQICLFLLTESRRLPGRLLQTSPYNRLRNSSRSATGRYALIDLDLSKYDRLRTRLEKERQTSQDVLKSGIATQNVAFNDLMSEIETVAIRTRHPIMLTGPTGAGKSQLARRIYELRRKRNALSGPFIEVNCATLRGDTAMSTLFGHRRGAFTGAQRDRPGLLRQANGGLLFLDEIGELGTDEQAMLLRALEDKTFLPLGSDQEAKSDFQLIAGTNRDLNQRVQQGLFREDLLARCNLWTFRLPGLAERREDIEPNIDYELARFADEENLRVTFNREARERFLAFAISNEATWKANFRDLNAAITRMATLSPHGRITSDRVDSEIKRLQVAWCTPDTHEEQDSPDLVSLMGEEAAAGIDPFDRAQLTYVIATCQKFNQLSEAGRYLFRESRKRKANPNDADRLRKYLHRFGLDWKAIRS